MRSLSLGWRIICGFGFAVSFAVALPMAFAQESPAPTPAQTPTAIAGGPTVLDQTPAPSISPSVSASPEASPSPLPSVVRPPLSKNIRISFLPPPLEGTISLGIYDRGNKLVRVLHQEAELDEFTIGDDALSTKWDGRDDDGLDLPPGKYQARGFAVGKINNDAIASAPSASPAATAGSGKITVRLMPNPLGNDAPGKVELAVGFDDENTFLKTTDGLPLYTISPKGNVQRAGINKIGERSAEVWQDDGTAVQQFKLSNLDKMMAFDCGDFELK